MTIASDDAYVASVAAVVSRRVVNAQRCSINHRPSWRVRDVDGESIEVRLAGIERYDDLQAVADAAVEGGGLAWLPRWLGAPSVAAGSLELVMDSDWVMSVDIHVVWPQTKYLPQRVRLTIDALAAQVPIFMG